MYVCESVCGDGGTSAYNNFVLAVSSLTNDGKRKGNKATPWGKEHKRLAFWRMMLLLHSSPPTMVLSFAHCSLTLTLTFTSGQLYLM